MKRTPEINPGDLYQNCLQEIPNVEKESEFRINDDRFLTFVLTNNSHPCTL